MDTLHCPAIGSPGSPKSAAHPIYCQYPPPSQPAPRIPPPAPSQPSPPLHPPWSPPASRRGCPWRGDTAPLSPQRAPLRTSTGGSGGWSHPPPAHCPSHPRPRCRPRAAPCPRPRAPRCPGVWPSQGAGRGALIAVPAGRAWPPCALRGHPRPSAPPPRCTGSTPGTSPLTARRRSPSDGHCHGGHRGCPLTRALLPSRAAHWRRASQDLHQLRRWAERETRRPSWPQGGALPAALHHRGGMGDSSGQQVSGVLSPAPEEAELGAHWQSSILLRGWGPVLDRLGTDPAGARQPHLAPLSRCAKSN